MKKKPAAAATTTAATGTKISTMLITVSTRSLVLSTLIIVLSVNTSSTFQYDWWNKLTNASSQDASRGIHDKAWLPADKTVRDKFWSTAWTPMISVTAEADVHPDEDRHKHKQASPLPTTPAASSDVPAAEAAAVTSFHPPALLSLSETASPSPPTPPAQSGISSSITSTTSSGKSESLEWQPSIVSSDHKDHDEHHNDADKEEEFNAFAARNTRTYVPLVKIRSKSPETVNVNHNPDSLMKQSNSLSASSSLRTQKVSWDDHVEFPSSTSLPPKLVSEVRATTTSIWADQGTSPAIDSITSSTNSRKWSSRTGPQRITNRFGSIKLGKQQKGATKSATIVEDFKQSQNLEKSYEDAVADIQSNSQQQQSSSGENGGSAGDVSGESERLSFAGKTSNRNQNKERLAVKGRLQSQEKKASARQQKRQKVALQIKISPATATVEQDPPPQQQQQQWSNAKVSQYFRWENPETSSERLVGEDDGSDDDQSSQKLRKQAQTSARDQGTDEEDEVTTTSAPRAITKTNVNRSGALKGVTKAFARQRKQSMTTTTLAPDYETEDAAVTERSVTTTRQPRLEASYEQASRQAVKSPQKKTRKSNTARLSTSAKSQSIVQSSGRGYEWSSDIDHNDERPAEIKSTTTAFGGEDRPPAESTRITNPTTTSIAATTTTTTKRTTTSTTTARPTASRLQTKSKQKSQRQTSVSVVKSSFEQNSDTSISSADSEDADSLMDEAKAKFQKKSGVQYSSSVEREEDVSVERDFSKKSGEQGSGNPDDPENCRLEDSIPGTPLTDYPTYSEIPTTSFKCSDQTLPGYYGDVEAQCQVFHVCQFDGRKNDFLCPVGTIFNQEIFVCDWWQNFRCQDTPNFYQNNDELYKTPVRTSEIANNQLRKRTDTIEREEDEEPPYSDEVRDDSGSSSSLPDDSSSNSAEDEVSSSTSRPAPVSRSQLAVKGYNEKQVVTEEPKVVTSGRIEVYGARMSRKQQRQQRTEKLAAAAATKSERSSILPPNGNLTEVVQSNVTMKMSTSALPLPVN